jgi:hypothetical protein
MFAFFMLAIAASLIVIDSFNNLWNANFSMLDLINYALLLLIIKEMIWTVLKFLRQEKFTLSPFIYIGVISSIREILFLGMQNSIENNNELFLSFKILINAFVVLLLVLSYYLFKKARVLAGEDS